jgi:hypothetical protein
VDFERIARKRLRINGKGRIHGWASKLSVAVAELKNPRRSLQLKWACQKFPKILDTDNEECKVLLRHLLLVGKMMQHYSSNPSPLPNGLNHQHGCELLIKIEKTKLSEKNRARSWVDESLLGKFLRARRKLSKDCC